VEPSGGWRGCHVPDMQLRGYGTAGAMYTPQEVPEVGVVHGNLALAEVDDTHTRRGHEEVQVVT
jgi:hypothetical protein